MKLSDTIRYGTVQEVKKMIRGVNIFKGPIPPFYVAIISGRRDMIHFFTDLLIRNPFRLNDPVFGPAHTFALTHGFPDVMIYLVSHGYDPNAKIGDVPILHLIGEDMAQSLIENGAEINATDSNGITCLMKACFRRMENLLVLLIQNQVDVNITDSRGNTALHFAVYRNFPEAVYILLHKGAKMTENGDGKTPIDIARCSNFDNIVQLIENFESNSRKNIPGTEQQIS